MKVMVLKYDVNEKTKALLLPKPVGNTNSEFMIENYFDLSGYDAEHERKYSLCNGAKSKSEFKFSTQNIYPSIMMKSDMKAFKYCAIRC